MSLGDGRIGFLDFGIVGRIHHLQKQQVGFIFAIAPSSYAQLADLVIELARDEEPDKVFERDTTLATDLEGVYSLLSGISLSEPGYG